MPNAWTEEGGGGLRLLSQQKAVVATDSEKRSDREAVCPAVLLWPFVGKKIPGRSEYVNGKLMHYSRR